MTKDEIVEKLVRAKKYLSKLEKQVPDVVREWLWDAQENLDYAVNDLELSDFDSEEDEEDLEED